MLESMIRYKDKDIERLSYLNQYLTEAQKKRDEIIIESQKEIQRLKQLLILNESKKAELSKKEQREMTFTSMLRLENSNPNLLQKKVQNIVNVNKAVLNMERQKTQSSRRGYEPNARGKQPEGKTPLNRVVKPVGISL